MKVDIRTTDTIWF